MEIAKMISFAVLLPNRNWEKSRTIFCNCILKIPERTSTEILFKGRAGSKTNINKNEIKNKINLCLDKFISMLELGCNCNMLAISTTTLTEEVTSLINSI